MLCTQSYSVLVVTVFFQFQMGLYCLNCFLYVGRPGEFSTYFHYHACVTKIPLNQIACFCGNIYGSIQRLRMHVSARMHAAACRKAFEGWWTPETKQRRKS
jgi:hypothetical protein